MQLLSILPWQDALALAWFIAVWVGYAWYSRNASLRGATLLAVTNAWRRKWMLQATNRDPRIVDGNIIQSLSSSPSFFASSTLIVIGGVLALFGAADQAAAMVREMPFAVTTTRAVFEIKLVVLASIFTFAFFRFTWAIRQYTFVALLLGAMPPLGEFAASRVDREAYADRTAALVGSAAESFNDGVRAYYFAFAVLAWFFSPAAFAVGAALVVAVLYGREFHSNVLRLLRD
jgi:uncharacterized membrane protein